MYSRRILFLILFISSLTAFAQNYPAVFDKNSLNGTNGFIVYGLNSEDALGTELSFIGDINHDGLEDIAINTEQIEPNGLVLGGTTYVIFGSENPYPSPFDLTTLNGTNGFILEGTSRDERIGKMIAKLGDINGDGIDDVSFGSQADKHIFLYGKQGAFPAKIVLADINGTNGFIFNLDGVNEIQSAGDVNGDGVKDIVIGHPHWSGQTFIVFGRTSNFPASINSAWLNGVNGFRLGEIPAGRSAYFATSAGDINNDGYDDILVGLWTGNSPAQTLSYVYFGHAAPFVNDFDLESVDGTNGFSVRNEGPGFLVTVSPLGDINGDGIDDCFAGNKVIFGSATPNAFHNDYTVNGTNGFLLPGYALTPADIGDVNFDGIDDFIVIAPNNTYWVVYGSRAPFPAVFDPAVLDGTKGFKIAGEYLSNIGRQMSGGADVNGDGKSDFMFATPFVTNYNDDDNGIAHGAVYVVFGGDHFAKPLTATYPKVRSITSSSFILDANAQETGVLYYAVYNGTRSTITNKTTILNGTGALQFGTIALPTASTTMSKVLSGLTFNTKYDVYAIFKDTAGNVGEIYLLNDVQTLGDAVPPVITCLATQSVACNSTLLNYTSLVTVTDNSGLRPVVTQLPAAGAPVVSNIIVTLRATDNAGNFSECTFTIGVTKAVLCPSPQNVLIGSQLLDYTSFATTTGFCNSTPVITQLPLPGTVVTGSTTVYLTATDANNATAICTFMISSQTTAVLKNQEAANALIIYPNPASDRLYVKGYDYSSYEIINNIGERVLQGGQDSEIALSGIANGMYMILFYNENQELVVMKKVVIE